MTHSTHFIYCYIASHMVKDHSDSERGNLLPPHGLLFPISSKITHTTAFVTPVVEHWLEREIAQWVHHEGSIRRHIAPWANTLTTELHIAPRNVMRSIKCDYLLVDIYYIHIAGTWKQVEGKWGNTKCGIWAKQSCFKGLTRTAEQGMYWIHVLRSTGNYCT